MSTTTTMSATTRSRTKGGAGRSLPRFRKANLSPFQICFVELFDRLRGDGFVFELNDGKASWPSGGTIGGKEYLLDLPDLTEKRLEVAFGSVVTEVPYKNSCADGRLLLIFLCLKAARWDGMKQTIEREAWPSRRSKTRGIYPRWS